MKRPIQQIQFTRASGDFNPIHQDDAFAKAAGMGGSVHKLSVRFAALVRPGDVITCHGRALEKRPARREPDDPQVDLEVWAENGEGEKVVTGRATVTLPSRG